MERTVVGFHLDGGGEWVADLDCGHQRHVRNRPPFEPRPWVDDAAARQARVGTPLECHLCARPEPWDDGGDPACWAGLLCPACGAVLDGSGHRPGCRDG